MGQERVRVQVVDRRSQWTTLVLSALLAACSQQAPVPQPVTVPAPVVEAPRLSPEEQRRADARRALELFDRKQWGEAVPALSAAASAYPEVAPFLRLRLADAEAARGNTQQAVAILSEIVAISDTSATTVARLRLPALYAQLGDRESADAAHQQASVIAIDELTEVDFVNMATALAGAGRSDLAMSTRMRLLTTYTQSRYTEQTFDFLQEELARLPAAEQSAIAAKLARANRYDQALALLPADAPEARATRLRALFNSRRYTELLAETADGKLTDPALMALRARGAWRGGNPQLFLSLLDEIEKKFPASKEAVDAKIVRAKYYSTDVIDYARSVQDLSLAIDAGGAGTDGETLWNLGWTYTLWGRHDDALKTFDRYIAAYPDGDWKTNSLFWSAKIYDKAGRAAERDARARQIVAEYPYSYYAYRAKELWPVARTVTSSALTAFPSIDLSTLDEPRLTIVRELQSIGLDRAAAREMKVVAAKHEEHAGVQFMLADVYVRGGEPFKANGVLQRRFRQFIRHGGAGIPRRFFEILYPLAYWDTIKAEAVRRGHDPYLIASIIRQESGFEPSTVSNAGAVGLMQIMPEEASRIAIAGGLDEIAREDLFNPQTNIAVGAAEFTQKLAAMDNNRTLAIAAYNAGQGPVGDWLQRTPIDDIDVFIESIPYAETRLYVKTVTRNRNEYLRIYEGS